MTTRERSCRRRREFPTAGFRRAAIAQKSRRDQLGTVPTRRGVSLLEVLISIFAISIGLLGVAALIPVGQFSVNEATKADRSAACGRAALSEVKIRNLLDPAMYLNPANGVAVPQIPSFGSTYVIDPRFCADADNWGKVPTGSFPYGGLSGGTSIFRLTVRRGPGLAVIDPAVADRIFTWRDDLVFDVDRENRDRRPRQSYVWDNGTVAPSPVLTEDEDPKPVPGTDTPLQFNTKGDYSWLLTVTPAATEIGQPTTVQKRKFDVSVAVFFSRDLTTNPTDPKPTERAVWATGAGLGGGDVTLTTDKPDPEYLDVKQNEWLMLTGWTPDSRVMPGNRRIAKWYRVIAMDEAPERSGSNWTRRVTLAGPDWDVNLRQPQAVLVDGVIGVYTKTIELDLDSIWN